jgi:hypothetical protein
MAGVKFDVWGYGSAVLSYHDHNELLYYLK